LGWKKDDVIDGTEFPCELKRRLPNNSQIQSAAAVMLTNIYKKGGAVQIHHHHPNRLKTKKNLLTRVYLTKRKKRNEKPLAVNDQQIMMVC
jgi:predicted ABC-class ATPase